MSAIQATRVAPTPSRGFAITRARQKLFVYECRVGVPTKGSLFTSLAVHALGLWLLAPIVFQTRVHISNVVDEITASDPIVIYAPSLPRTVSAPADAARKAITSEGRLKQSRADEIRVVSVVNEAAPVVLASAVPIHNQDSNLASMLAVGIPSPTLAPQAIEIGNGIKRAQDVPPRVADLRSVRSHLTVPTSSVRVVLGPQPVEIASGASSAEPSPPQVVASTELPRQNPVLPVPAGASVQLLNVPSIAGGRRRFGGVPDAGAAAAASMPTGASLNGSSALSGALAGVGRVTVVNPVPGSTLAKGGMRDGRLAASPQGVTAGRGLGKADEGSSNDGTDGASLLANGIGVSGSGTRGASPIPSAGGTDEGSTVAPITVSNGKIELGSFGPSVDRRAHGNRPAVVIVGSASSTSTLDRFTKSLRGDIYTVYLNVSGKPAVLQFAEQRPRRRSFDSAVSPPEAIFTDLPVLASGKQVVSCVLNSQGKLTQIHSLLVTTEEARAALVRSLAQWRFVPASRNEIPVDVDVVIGFGIGTD